MHVLQCAIAASYVQHEFVPVRTPFPQQSGSRSRDNKGGLKKMKSNGIASGNSQRPHSVRAPDKRDKNESPSTLRTKIKDFGRNKAQLTAVKSVAASYGRIDHAHRK